MIYLASPYSHPDSVVRAQRHRDVCRAAVALIKLGHAVYSPIAHSHALVEHGLPIDWSFWERHDRNHLAHCDEVVVLMLDGWEASVGVREEVRIANEINKPVRYIDIARLVDHRTTSDAISAS
jgi:hypothetical protein